MTSPRTDLPYAIEYDASDLWITVTDAGGAAVIVADCDSVAQFNLLVSAVAANVRAEAAVPSEAVTPPHVDDIAGPHPESPEWHAGYRAGRDEAREAVTPPLTPSEVSRAITTVCDVFVGLEAGEQIAARLNAIVARAAVGEAVTPLDTEGRIHAAAIKACEAHYEQQHVVMAIPCAPAIEEARWWYAALASLPTDRPTEDAS